jgi:hypothetical protein
MFLTLSTSVAFCFVFRRPDAFRLSFAFGALGFFLFYAVTLIIAIVRRLAMRQTNRENIRHSGESAISLVVSRTVLILALI